MHSVKQLLRQPFGSYSLYLGFLLLSIQGVCLGLTWQQLPPVVPFFYSLPWGEEQLAQKIYLLLNPVISALVIVVNMLLAAFFYHREMVISQILMWSAVLFASIATIGLIQIVLLIL